MRERKSTAWFEQAEKKDHQPPSALLPAQHRPPPESRSLKARAFTEASAFSRGRQSEFNSLASLVEERQLAFERAGHTLASAKVIVDTKTAADEAASQELAEARAAAQITLAVDPAVAQILKLKELEALLESMSRSQEAAAQYSATLEHMLQRSTYEQALVKAELEDVQSAVRDAGRELRALASVEGDARREQGAALKALAASRAAQRSNRMLYAAALRKQRIDTQGSATSKARHAAPSATMQLGGSGSAADGEPASGAGEGEEEERLKRMLIASRMSSLVLMQERDSQVEQISRYEAAFLKMARVAGSSSPEAVIQKFVSRNEVRARLLDERQGMRQRVTTLEAELKRQSARVTELQYSMVHPADAEVALRQVEPRLAAAAARLEQLEEATARLARLQLAVHAGATHLQRLVAARPVATADAESTTATEPPVSPPKETEEAVPAAPSRPVSEESLLGILREVEAKVVKVMAAVRQDAVVSPGATSSRDLAEAAKAATAAKQARQQLQLLEQQQQLNIRVRLPTPDPPADEQSFGFRKEFPDAPPFDEAVDRGYQSAAAEEGRAQALEEEVSLRGGVLSRLAMKSKSSYIVDKATRESGY